MSVNFFLYGNKQDVSNMKKKLRSVNVTSCYVRLFFKSIKPGNAVACAVYDGKTEREFK